MNTLVSDLMSEAAKSLATMRECEVYIEQLNEHIRFCKPEHRIHVFSGIDQLADALEAATVLREYDDQFAPFYKSFQWEGFEFFQLSEKDGSFR